LLKAQDVKYLSRKIMEAGEIPLLWGHFGVGKTDLAREIAEETGRRLVILVISQMEPGDLIGMPSRDGERTLFLRPDWWPTDGNVILMIDEVNRAHRSIRNAIMQLLIDKRIHNHFLPEGSWIIAAANPPDEEYDQVELITDPAFMSRFFHIELTPDPEEWLKWSKQQNVPDCVTRFIGEYPEFLSRDTIVSMRLELRPSPRSWYKLGRVFGILQVDEIEKYGYVLAAGIVGPEAARTFMSKIQGNQLLPSPRTLLVELDDIILKRISQSDISGISASVMRITRHLSELDEMQVQEYFQMVPKIAGNLLEIGRVIPRDSFFSIIRHLVHQIEGEKGLKRALFENLLEELAMDHDVMKFLQGSHESEK
jgi:alkaline phosphatase D